MDGIHGEATGFIGGLGENRRVHGNRFHPGWTGGAATVGIRPGLTSRHSLYSRQALESASFQGCAGSFGKFVKKILHQRAGWSFFPPHRDNDPFVYRLGLQIFILAIGVRFPYGLLSFHWFHDTIGRPEKDGFFVSGKEGLDGPL